MKDFEFYEIVGNPETITEEMFNSFTRSEQLEVLEYRPDLLEFFQKNYPDLTADEEIELIRHGWLDFKDATAAMSLMTSRRMVCNIWCQERDSITK